MYSAPPFNRPTDMVTERARAQELGLADPIHASIEDTHKSYNDALRYLTEEGFPTIVATHNRESVEHLKSLMQAHGIPKQMQSAGDTQFGFAQVRGGATVIVTGSCVCACSCWACRM